VLVIIITTLIEVVLQSVCRISSGLHVDACACACGCCGVVCTMLHTPYYTLIHTYTRTYTCV
jgi:hypothetical protein